MTDPGDIWQRYDAKVMQIQAAESRLAAMERELGQTRDERDHWTHVCRDLGKKLSVARTLAQRLRTAERVKDGPSEASQSQMATPSPGGAPSEGDDRAREVLGLVLTALSRALDDEATAELGRKLRDHAGGKLLHSITRGSLTLVPVDGRYRVDRSWLEALDLGGLRRELDAATLAGGYEAPTLLPTRVLSVSAPQVEVQVEVQVDLEDDEALPPPPPSAVFRTLPPLLSALPDEGEIGVVRAPAPEPTRPGLRAVLIPRLTIDRLIKNPGAT